MVVDLRAGHKSRGVARSSDFEGRIQIHHRWYGRAAQPKTDSSSDVIFRRGLWRCALSPFGQLLVERNEPPSLAVARIINIYL